MSTAGQRRALGKKGRILEALRRSPLVGADLDLGRPRENRRMGTMAARLLFDPPVPNAESVEALKAGRHCGLVTVGSVDDP
jgi:hypothetical protein